MPKNAFKQESVRTFVQGHHSCQGPCTWCKSWANSAGPLSLGLHPITQEEVCLTKGRYGFYVQLGDSNSPSALRKEVNRRGGRGKPVVVYTAKTAQVRSAVSAPKLSLICCSIHTLTLGQDSVLHTFRLVTPNCNASRLITPNCNASRLSNPNCSS